MNSNRWPVERGFSFVIASRGAVFTTGFNIFVQRNKRMKIGRGDNARLCVCVANYFVLIASWKSVQKIDTISERSHCFYSCFAYMVVLDDDAATGWHCEICISICKYASSDVDSYLASWQASGDDPQANVTSFCCFWCSKCLPLALLYY